MSLLDDRLIVVQCGGEKGCKRRIGMCLQMMDPCLFNVEEEEVGEGLEMSLSDDSHIDVQCGEG